MKIFHLLLIILFMLTASASGADELYKYVDENGNTRYTDDISLVPQDQRGPYLKDLQEAEAEENETEETAETQENQETDVAEETGTTEEGTTTGTDTTEGAQETPQAATEEEDNWPQYGDDTEDPQESLDEMLERLNTTRAELKDEYAAIQEDKKALAASKKDATTPETINAYNDKARAINARAKKYKEKYEALQTDLGSYNSQVQELNQKNEAERAAAEEKKAEEEEKKAAAAEETAEKTEEEKQPAE